MKWRAIGISALVLSKAVLFSVACAPQSRDAEVRDETRWLKIRWIDNIDSIQLRCVFEESFPLARRELYGEWVEQELTSRGFSVSADAQHRLEVRFRAPLRGSRGLPVSSRYCKVRVDVALIYANTEDELVQGRVDGLIDEGAFGFLDKEREKREARAIRLAIGKIGRELHRLHRGLSIAGDPAPPFPVVPEAERATLAIIDFAIGDRVDGENGIIVANQFRDVLSGASVFALIDREKIKDVLGEQDFAAATRCEQAKCLVSYGRLLHAQKMMHGRVSKQEQRYILYVAIVDVNTSRMDAMQETFGGSTEGLLRGVEPLAKRLVARMRLGSKVHD